MNIDEFKEQLLALMTTLKLTEKDILSCEDDAAKWKNRLELAQARSGMDELIIEAERNIGKINDKLADLREEKRSLEDDIAEMRRQLPVIASKERSIDPDILEQELLMTLGYSLEDAETERKFRKLEKESAVDDALLALKAKMNQNKDGGDTF